MLAFSYISMLKLFHKNRDAFYKKYKRTPKVWLKKKKKEVDDYFSKTSKAELRKIWDDISQQTKL